MKPYLLDVNVLIALAWPSHVHHQDAQEWFARKKKAGFRTCPLTEIGFVRISCNPRFTPDAVSPAESCAMLSRITSWPGHGFWPDHLPFVKAVGEDHLIAGYRQVTDAYLLALAIAHEGKLATLDCGLRALVRFRDTVEFVQEG